MGTLGMRKSENAQRESEQLIADLKYLEDFMSSAQLSAIKQGLQGEERMFFVEKVTEYAERIRTMPATYEARRSTDDPLIYLHYFGGRCDFHIVEKDAGDEEEPGQHQAYGYANLGYGAESGYISLVEILGTNRIELDLHWTPIPVSEWKAAQEAREDEEISM
jgi:hypothetical protein